MTMKLEADGITVRAIADDRRFIVAPDALFTELVAELGMRDALIWWNAAADLVAFEAEGEVTS